MSEQLPQTESGIAIPRTDAGHPVVYIHTDIPGLALHTQGDPEDFLKRFVQFANDPEQVSLTWDDPIHGDTHYFTRAAIPHIVSIGRGYSQRLNPIKRALETPRPVELEIPAHVAANLLRRQAHQQQQNRRRRGLN